MLEVIVFVCGAVVMILEMVGSRVLAPYLGTSIVVWTSLIGIILGSLSLGYWWGGRLADVQPNRRMLSKIILMSAAFVAFIAILKTAVLSFLQQQDLNIHLGSSTATLFLFAPPSVLLGMVSPYAVRLKMTEVAESGKTVGNLYAISTVGSIFGTFLAGFFLIAHFGSTNILIVLALVLAVTSFLASRDYRAAQTVSTVVFIALLWGADAYDRYLAARDFHDIDTDYNRILIYRETERDSGRETRVMVTNPHGKQSAMYLDDPVELASRYTRFYRLMEHFMPGFENVLMLGGGGYSFPKYALVHYPRMKMDVVEIDPRVTELARTHFGLWSDPRLTVHHEDARTFLNKLGAAGNRAVKYDMILGDTFNAHYSIPFHVSTVETVRLLHDNLADDGIVLANILASIEGDMGRFLRAEYATFKAVFPHVHIFPVTRPDDPARLQNVMLLALKSDAQPSFTSNDPEMGELLGRLWKKPIPRDVPVLTDDFAPVDRYAMGD